MDDATLYPTEFSITNAREHDVNQLEVLVNQPEATYVFDRGYLDFERLDQIHWDGYFFVTRIKKNTKVHVLLIVGAVYQSRPAVFHIFHHAIP